jgi:hypothetical protein
MTPILEVRDVVRAFGGLARSRRASLDVGQGRSRL